MNVGIVAPSPVPFGVGGAEKLFWGLLDAINHNTSHHAELIKLPSSEMSFQELLETYKSFAGLDVSHFDFLISTKYPAWMVLHANHHVYMLHKLRGLYDTYPQTFPLDYDDSFPSVKAIKEHMLSSRGERQALERFWELISNMQKEVNCNNSLFGFPGPFIRDILHYLDSIGLAPQYIKRYAAISSNVVNRKDYFPINSKVEAIYPPSNLKYFKTGRYDYFFTVSRLDSAKRIALVIEAMRHVKADIPLFIAGTGSDEAYLKSLADGDKRIKFLGFVSDDDVIELYSNALAVPYIPYDEDYGLVTIEAMMSRKPVLTFTDSGGVNEFVENGKTGYSVTPDPVALGAKMEFFAKQPDEAHAMGKMCYDKVKHITWENTVSRILQEKACPSKIITHFPVKKKKMAIAVTFPIYPPMGGGQLRVYHLYKNLTKHWDIDIVSFTSEYGRETMRREIAPGLREICVSASQEHWQEENDYMQKLGVPLTDVVMPRLYKKTQEYVETFRETANNADFLVACHPYFIDLILDVNSKSLPIIYEAQDVEYFLKKTILPSTDLGNILLEEVRETESKACETAHFIYATSSDDATSIKEFYKITDKKIAVIPNGVDTKDIPFIEKKAPELKKDFSLLFIGSWHGPNIEAMYEIFSLARQLPYVSFLIAGSVCNANNREVPVNVKMLGVLTDTEKLEVLSSADFSINPMKSGSGTNLKMLEAFSVGLPVLSTSIGARGFDVVDGKHLFIRELDDFTLGVLEVLESSWKELDKMRRLSRELVVNKYDWHVIARELDTKLNDINDIRDLS